MQIASILQVVLALLLTICSAAPHMLVTVNSDLQPAGTFKSCEVPPRKFPGLDLVKRQDTEDSTSPTPSLASVPQLESPTTSSPATPVYNASPVTTTSIEELESMWGPPFRRSLASVVAQNVPSLIKPKTEAGVPGYEAFAESVRQGLAHSKRDLIGFFTRDDKSYDGTGVTECRGRWYDCMRKYGSKAALAIAERTLKTHDGCAKVGDHWDCAGRVAA
ncbi:hypothetical protein MMC17_005533 [Xylographa soralifera]|nr:hypothetical protein [Xylographa soralifera]